MQAEQLPAPDSAKNCNNTEHTQRTTVEGTADAASCVNAAVDIWTSIGSAMKAVCAGTTLGCETGGSTGAAAAGRREGKGAAETTGSYTR